MTIENTLERIATALERIVDLQTGRNLILEAGAVAAEVAEAAVEKAATKGRGRPRKTEAAPEVAPEEPKVEEVKQEAAPEPAPAAEAQPEPVKEEPKALAANAPTIEQLQLRAPALAKKFGKRVTELIKEINPEHGNLSSMNDAQRCAFWAALDALEAGATAPSEFG